MKENKPWLTVISIALTCLGLTLFSWLVPVAVLVSLSARTRNEKYAYASIIISIVAVLIIIAIWLRALIRY